jgi:hypothetical protein
MASGKPRFAAGVGISGVLCMVGATTANAGNEAGELTVSPTAAKPTSERSGVTARPAKGISAAVKSEAEA